MKMMVACTTLTWINVDTETGEIGPARVFNLDENVTVEKWDAQDGTKSGTAIAQDAEEEDLVTQELIDKAVALVTDGPVDTWVFEERTR